MVILGSGMVVSDVDVGEVIQLCDCAQPHVDSSRALAFLGLAMTKNCRVDVSFVLGLASR